MGRAAPALALAPTKPPLPLPQAGAAPRALTLSSGPAPGDSEARGTAPGPTATLGPTNGTLIGGSGSRPIQGKLGEEEGAERGIVLQKESKRGNCSLLPPPSPLGPAASGPPRCAGICDDDIAACYCDPKLGNPKYGRIPAPPGSPPGTPPVQEGRPLFDPCNRLADDGHGHKLEWHGRAVPFDSVYGPQGWCVADVPKVRRRNRRAEGSGEGDVEHAGSSPVLQGGPTKPRARRNGSRTAAAVRAPVPGPRTHQPHDPPPGACVRLRARWLWRPWLQPTHRNGLPQPMQRPRRLPPWLLPLQPRLVGPRLRAPRQQSCRRVRAAAGAAAVAG
jgi:hypothetical protein